ncbi:MAG: GNAT family N-acetyltransferase [Bacteroides sp.]|nr:GNAT family N-acetyltransferase [Bacteroides sp.]
MRPQKLNDLKKYTALIDKYSAKGAITNNYMLPTEVTELLADGKISECHDDNNCYLLVEKPGNVLRLYFILNDLSTVPMLECDKPIVSEILFRGSVGEPKNEIKFLEKAGFFINLRRDQYSAVFQLSGNEVISEYPHSVRDAEEAINLFNSTFDIYSGDFIPPEAAEEFLNQRSLLCAYDDNGCLVGSLHINIIGKNAWISHLVVKDRFRGQGVANKLMNMFIYEAKSHNVRRLMLWVQHRNEKAILLYKKYGFSYTNKSTISLIKN